MSSDKLREDYNDFFERPFKGKKIPNLSSEDVDSYIQEISGNRLSGGIIKSKDGKLVINLESGELTYQGVSVI